MYVMGENPAMSDPDANHAREALAALEHLVVQDIFFTETAYLADVILPASAFPEKTGTFTNTDRLVQIGRQALDPPGDARQDLWIIQQIAQAPGPAVARRRHVVGGVRRDAPDDAEHRRHHLGAPRARARGHVSVHATKATRASRSSSPTTFPREGGRARFVPADIIPADERPDAEYPMVLITGRQLEHWHTGSMTRRAGALDALEPDPVALVHPLDLAAIGGKPGDVVTIESRRGEVALYARADDSSPRGAVFVPFCYYEAAINRLTNAALDPFAQDPRVQVLRGAPRRSAARWRRRRASAAARRSRMRGQHAHASAIADGEAKKLLTFHDDAGAQEWADRNPIGQEVQMSNAADPQGHDKSPPRSSVGAYNRAFSELGLEWSGTRGTYRQLQACAGDKHCVQAYIEAHHPHLLQAYAGDSLPTADRQRCVAA